MAKYVWQCIECAKVVQNEGEYEPMSTSIGSCQTLTGYVGHHWVRIGKVGNSRYHCRRCGITVMLDPNYSIQRDYCPVGARMNPRNITYPHFWE